MRNFIIILFALGLIGCVGCSETSPTWYQECGISRTEAVSISFTGLGDGWSAACGYTQEDLDPTGRCNKPHYSLCEYYWCLASYPEIAARMNVCAENHRNGNGDAGTTDVGGTTDAGTIDTGMNTDDVFGGDTETDTGADATDDVPTNTEDAEAQDAGMDAGEDTGEQEPEELPQVEWCNEMNEELPPETDPEVVEDRNRQIEDFCEAYISPEWADGVFGYFEECDALCGLEVNGHYP